MPGAWADCAAFPQAPLARTRWSYLLPRVKAAMMNLYRIDSKSNFRRKAVEEWLPALDLVAPDVRDRIVTAWVSAWSSSPYQELFDMPFTPDIPDYPLVAHISEVTRAGLDLAHRAAADWGASVDYDVLVSILTSTLAGRAE